MIKIVLSGAAGRMGREIINMVKDFDDIEIVAGIEHKNSKFINKTIDNVKITHDITTVIKSADCVVEFTNHTSTMENLRKVKEFKKPYIIGTTGFSTKELEEIKDISKELPILVAPNMSLGINHLYKVVESTAKVLVDYDVEIVETHHRGKKDAPSGTAKAIARIISGVRPNTRFIYGREGAIGERKKGEICINSVRGGDIAGEHRVIFLGEGEFIEIRHYATSRKCFAAGTIEAVRFIVSGPAGLYTMQDILKS